MTTRTLPASRPLSDEEIDAIRAQHNSDNQHHGKAGCKVCRLLATIDSMKATLDATQEALAEALRHG